MDYYDFVASAIAAVASLYNANAELAHLQKIGVKDVCVLWCGSTLQNNKAWLSTTVPDCMYYEATHQRAGGPALTEFTGTDAQTITFDIELAAYLGVNPTKERERLQECVLNGTTLPFVLGNVVYGSYRWVIKSVKFKTLHTDAFGTPTWITASVSLLEYQRE